MKRGMEMWIFKRYGIGYKPKHNHGVTTRIPGWGYITYLGLVKGEGWEDCCRKARKILGSVRMNRGRIRVAYRWLRGYGYVATFKNGIPDEEWPSAEGHVELQEMSYIIHTIDLDKKEG